MEEPQSEEKQHFKLGEFEGPLDLLLFLIRKNEVNIYDIPISQITEQYLSYLEYAAKVGLDNITEFYLLAATLLYIKSRMLLPVEVDLDEEFDDPRQELVDRLIEYQKYKKFSELIEEKEQQAEWVVERKKKQRILPFPEDERMWEELDVWDLLKTFSTIMTSISSERIIDLYEEVSINEKLSLIFEFIEKREDFFFSDLITKDDSVMELVCAFLAILEAVKTRKIIVFQNRLFGDIRIRGRMPEPEKEEEII
ncbi:MAG: segregation/condensation protein A [Spirochaetales bacterium]|nr:segregation/condensation protein A [Spirochaetales bacterium]